MSAGLQAELAKRRWEASKRPQESGRIKGALKPILQKHKDGFYDEAVEEIRKIPGWEQSAEAWRVLGHAEHGRKNFEAAAAAHRRARLLHGNNRADASDDMVNLAAVYISAQDYSCAWDAANEAINLAQDSLTPKLTMIAILNRQGRQEELLDFLRHLLNKEETLLENPKFNDHLKNDTDFIGVDDLLATLA